MEDSRSYPPPQIPKSNKPKSNFSSQVSNFLCKSILVVVFLVVIPMFPSQTPEIFNNSLLNKCWELFHLLFIGLAVCYGLFSRRSSDLESSEHTLLIDESQNTFVSRIFHVAPIFEDGSEIQCGSDEKNGYFNWDESRLVNDEQIKIGGVSGSGSVSEVLEEDGDNVVEAWSSRYVHGESESVVVSEPKQWGKPQNVGGFRPLGLPVRSLSSRVQNVDSGDRFSNRSLSDSSLIGSSDCPQMEVEVREFGGRGEVNLDENVCLSSENPWGYRAVRPELSERVVPLSRRSRVRDADNSHQFSNGNLSGSSLPKSMQDGEENFSDQGLVNSDEKLNENVFLPSENPWGCRSVRPELRERVVSLSSRSRVLNSDGSHQFSNGSVSDSSLVGSSNCSPKSTEEEEENFGGRGVVNLDEKLNENVFLPSENPWGSRPGRPELRERAVPVSNRSRSRKSDGSQQFNNGSVSVSSLMGSSNCSPKRLEEVEEKFGDQDPVIPDEKLNENAFLSSQNPWISRPGRSESRERVVPPSNRSHFRPRSVDETQFESFKSQSLRSNASLSSQTNSVSTSPDMLSPSHSSSSDSPKSVTEKQVRMEEKEATLSPLATESPKREAPLNAFHLRKYSSSGSLFQKNTQKRAKDDPKNPSHKRREDEQQQGSLKPDKKSTNSAKTSSRGKSVRTIRSDGHTPEAKKDGDTSKLHMNDYVDKRRDADLTKKKNVDSNYKVPKPTFTEYQMREKKEALEKVMVESEHDSEPEIDDVLVRLAKKVPPPSASNSGHDPNEVDKKASEFIAKFREQIRLQKVASMERSKVIRMSVDNCLCYGRVLWRRKGGARVWPSESNLERWL
ncbi:hypothetical protein M5689_005043 [Euphorbia peplus]|nr:hypothetical protein M5689_005043 [Euphorbia peplus]